MTVGFTIFAIRTVLLSAIVLFIRVISCDIVIISCYIVYNIEGGTCVEFGPTQLPVGLGLGLGLRLGLGLGLGLRLGLGLGLGLRL